MIKNKSCCFLGHRDTVATPELCERLRQTMLHLIEEKGVTRFLFGSASKFDDLCLKIATELKHDYPEIKRVYVRSNYPQITAKYENYLLETYDETYMPERIENAGKASYVERNQEMIDGSDFIIFYYDENYTPKTARKTKSGTKLAYEYALRKSEKGAKVIINMATPPNSL